MKRVLIISYYWPPSGKASLHWPVAITNHLPKFGWQPIIFTVKNEGFTQKDFSLVKKIDPNLKVIKTPVIEVFNFYKKFLGKNKSENLSVSEVMSLENSSIKQKISLWIRMNLFVPDARVTWYPFAIKYGKKLIKEYLNNNKLDAIISIGTPHSTHLIGSKLAKYFHTKHIPFFSDPWTTISYYDKFKRNKIAEKLDKYLERKILLNSYCTLFVTKSTALEYETLYPFLRNKTNVLYWGYNEEDFKEFDSIIHINRNEKTIIHSGNLFDYQNPIKFWQTVKKQIENGNKLKIKFTGTVGKSIVNSINELGLEKYTEYLGFLSYKELLIQLKNADYFLACAYNKKHIPGKIFEYLRMGKPIIAFCDDNEELKNILHASNAGLLFNYNETGEQFFNQSGKFHTNLNFVKKFERENITKQLVEILNN